MVTPSKAAPVDYLESVKPLFQARCYTCHGAVNQENGLRLDTVAAIRTGGESGEAVVPGKAAESLLIKAVTTGLASGRMPPRGKGLSKAQVALLRDWINEGAAIVPGEQPEVMPTQHWAFQRPSRPSLPETQSDPWVNNAIDAFVLSRLQAKDLRPAAAASTATLHRRLALDLGGLPPSLIAMRTLEADKLPGSVERLVDQYLASPRFGEQMAQSWLDAARYADTTGHAADKPRTMWLYRDWVIDAFNSGMTFDQFTVEQLAGDMLPGATQDQRVATGFHRNSLQALGNNPRKEEFRIKGIVDRIETTGKTWLGLTVACAECHDHKYDPLSQEEYYKLFAVFNNIPHYGNKFDVHGPRIKVLPRKTKTQIRRLQQELDVLAQKHKEGVERQDPPQTQSELRKWAGDPGATARQQQTLFQVRFPGELVAELQDGKRLPALTGWLPTKADRWAAEGPFPSTGVIRLGENEALVFEASQVPRVDGDFSFAMWVKTRQGLADLVSKYDWKSGRRSYVFGIGGQGEQGSEPGRLYAWVSDKPNPFRGPIAYGSISVNDGQWHHVAMSYTAGTSLQLYVDGQLDEKARVKGPFPKRVADSVLPLVIGGGFNNSSKPNDFFVRGEIADVRMLGRPLTGRQLGGFLASERKVLQEFARGTGDPVPAAVAQWFSEVRSSYPGAADVAQAIRTRITTLQQQTVTAQVMTELEKARDTFVHLRGDFENPGGKVVAGIPRVLKSVNAGGDRIDRLDFARSLVDGSNPLVARVAVNRVWAHYFGVGLVRTPADFGTRGERPTHPELLDWLAVELMESGWDLKHIHRLIATSATYQQSSSVSKEMRQQDPGNRMLARGPRVRLGAEAIRDLALVASGHFEGQVGGPSVYPEQPLNVGQYRDDTAGKWQNSPGAGQYRRSIYTFWQRMSPYPSLVLLDAPSRERCEVQRSRSNTPLQALALLNDPHLVTLARGFGTRIEQVSHDFQGRLEFAFLTVLARRPTRHELEGFRSFVGEKPDSDTWFRLAQVLLNLDEAITKE